MEPGAFIQGLPIVPANAWVHEHCVEVGRPVQVLESGIVFTMGMRPTASAICSLGNAQFVLSVTIRSCSTTKVKSPPLICRKTSPMPPQTVPDHVDGRSRPRCGDERELGLGHLHHACVEPSNWTLAIRGGVLPELDAAGSVHRVRDSPPDPDP